ncbi:MAG: opacity protein-like surface antigen [Maribacter sp.]
MKYIVIMKKLFYIFLLILPYSLSAQIEAGVQVGVSNYLGDLAPSSLWTSLGETNFSAGVFARYNTGKWISIKAGFNYAKISAADSNGSPTVFKEKRNLSFRSNIYEIAVTGEFNILGYQPYNLERVFSPYIFVGIAGYKFNPQTQYEGGWVKLQPLGTEGQGMDGKPAAYKTVQISIPFGAGLKYAINDKWNLGLEIGFRKTFTDYLDDVSGTYVDLAALAAANGDLAAELSWRGDEISVDAIPPEDGTGRGNIKNKDWYLISVISVSYNFSDNGLVGGRGRLKRKKGCDF